MAFPVDLLNNCSHEELENAAEDYMSDLRCGDPENPEYFSFLNITIPISLSNVGFVPLYGGDQTQKVLALFAPEDSLTAVALYLADQWWAIDDIVKASVLSREGLKQLANNTLKRQKNQSEEQSEASSEQLDQFTQSTEKALDSSSEEIEVEVPVVDRQNLRRKAKGPAKKKAKLT
ncbi:Soluble lamin-associated protein of 75 kDa [Sciurus carolinensis]|uniref:Soluble lamin-associated protein of 75 kDa n=1 Tax=Sciurus carolinensis TaxID=30640 RepID=A0AA41N9F6_SCICA|nr:Soluble lamin-associated protein of 75 kDa [Sciurus carolinensis]